MILAVDPGLGECGWAVVTPKTGAVVELGVFVSERENAYDISTDRIQRLDRLACTLGAVADRHSITAIAAEGITLGGPPHIKLAMAPALFLSWGVLTELARSRGVPLFEVMPKVWQHAIQPGTKKINYDKLEKAMAAHVGPQVGAQLALINKSLRTHALDACGVGMFAALRPHEATRIVQERQKVVASEPTVRWSS